MFKTARSKLLHCIYTVKSELLDNIGLSNQNYEY